MADSRSAVPVAGPTSISITSPFRFSIRVCAMKTSLASLPGPLRHLRASGSVVLWWVAFERFWPWKSTQRLLGLPPSGRFGGGGSSLESKALETRRCFDQGAVHTEMLVAQQVQSIGLEHHRVEELATDAVPQQPRAVLRKGAVIEARARADPYPGT